MEPPNKSSTLVFFVNGIKVEDNDVDPEWTLIYYLRKKLRLCGTKLGCSEGGCGACTVMVSKYDRAMKKPIHYALNACLTPICAVHGLAVTTVEGIGSTQTKLHPVQETIAKSHGSQCGFCTPGIVMSMYTLLRSQSKVPTVQDMEEAFQGNLCRCTGYRPILQGYKNLLEEYEKSRFQNGSNGINGCSAGKMCCKNMNGNEELEYKPSKPYDPTQEPIFPPELSISDKYDTKELTFYGPRVRWHRPVTLDQLINLKHEYPDAKIVNGNTEIGVEVKFKNCLYTNLITPNMIEDLKKIEIESKNGKEYIKIGAAVTLSQLEHFLLQMIDREPEWRTRIFREMCSMMKLFAGKQIRNAGTLAGNIMTGSPISDLNPILMCVGSQLMFYSKGSSRMIEMDSNFWTGYRKNISKDNEVLGAIFIPFTTREQHFKAFKQSKRRDDDIAIVNAAFLVELSGEEIKFIKMAYGGMAPTTVIPVKTCSTLSGTKWNENIFEKASASLVQEITLEDSAPGGMVQYRRALMLSLFFKFFLSVSDTLKNQGIENCLPKSYLSGKNIFHNLPLKFSQYYSKPADSQAKYDSVGRPLVHVSAYKQACGEAVYCDDMPIMENESYICLVTSTRAYARIISIDASKALLVPGVLDFVSAKDVSEEGNRCGPVVHDEEVFASKIVYCQGQVIGGVVAIDHPTAYRASKLVKIEYEDLKPAIITIEDAIEQKSFFECSPLIMKNGDAEKEMENESNILEGQIRIGGQEHFYLETHNTVVIPKKEDNELEIISSNQHPTDLQVMTSHVLGIPSNRIVCKVKRIGGGFGGKETRSCLLALPAVVAAHKLKRPVRFSMDRDEDMAVSGHRHPFLAKYKVAFSSQGRIKSVILDLYNNAGWSTDLSPDVMDRAMTHCMNAYNIPNLICRGYVCKTNLPSNTAFRGFGAPQSMLVAETIVTQIAEKLKMDVDNVREINMLKEGDITFFGHEMSNCNLQKCWTECISTSEYKKRKNYVQKYNTENKFRKKGLSLVPLIYGVGFATAFLEQAGALVLVYVDGSVLISHGGTEMGQGLHTKMIQVASRALEVPVEEIHISETSTDKVPNTSPTAASVSSDYNGMAILRACETLKKRLEPLKAKNPNATWKELVKKAYFDRISLSACGYYHPGFIPIDAKEEKGRVFNYYSFGSACSEVEIDCLTGDHQVIRTDIVMDVGESINPAIDVGQIEGAFMQGYGLYTMEEVVTSPTGGLYTKGPGAYKIPSFSDIPGEFNVTLLKGSSNPRAVYSSKAVGEPPLLLSSSIFFAIREAVKSARSENGIEEPFEFNSPATCAKIRMACTDNITKMLPMPKKDVTPWNIEV